MNNWKHPNPPFAKHKKEVFLKAAKVSSFIHQIGEYPPLRQPSSEVDIKSISTPEMKRKIAYLSTCLLKYRKLTGYGRGITAVQVGIPERFSIIYTSQRLITIINPHIIKKSRQLLRFPEICMSASPIVVPIVRPAWIEFIYYDEKGEKNIWNTKADSDQGKIMNRVFQHEFDHMNGVINIDIIKNPKEIILESDPDFYKKATFEAV